MNQHPSPRPRLVRLMAAVIASLLLIYQAVGAGSTPQEVQPPLGPQVTASLILSYQGRLLDPATGLPKPDGAYAMVFKLYDVQMNGTALWSESKNVNVAKGLFSTALGDTVALNPAHFDGRALGLGVSVGADPEMTPRQGILFTAYGIYSRNSDLVDNQHASAFAAASHTHSGSAITSGTVLAAWIDGAITRDDEIMPIVTANDGAGSGLDADLVDGLHASTFASVVHTHSAADLTSGTLSTGRYSAIADLSAEGYLANAAGDLAQNNGALQASLNSDLLDGYHATDFVSKAGDTMSGALTVPRVLYTAPHPQYFVIGGEGFVPGSNVDYFNTYGSGGAYIVSGSGALVAPVHLPQGAVVTEFRVFFYDGSASNMSVYLYAQGMDSSYSTMAEVSSAGISGYGDNVDTGINGNPIANTVHTYCVYAYSSAWNSDMRIKGALITYTISEAP